MPMKHDPRWAVMLALVFSLIGLRAWAESSQPLPTPFPEARYQQMSAKSPFAVATAGADAGAAPTPGFAANLYVDGVSHLLNKDWVAIKSRDPDDQQVIFQEVGTTTPDGMKVVSVKWSSETGKSTVDVTKGGEKATLTFDESQIAKNAGPAPGQPGLRLPTLPGQGRMGFPGQNGGFNQPGMAYNRNRVFPQQQVNGVPGSPNGAGPGMETRRRVRVIQRGQ